MANRTKFGLAVANFFHEVEDEEQSKEDDSHDHGRDGIVPLQC
jgi:hypothetical protein